MILSFLPWVMKPTSVEAPPEGMSSSSSSARQWALKAETIRAWSGHSESRASDQEPKLIVFCDGDGVVRRVQSWVQIEQAGGIMNGVIWDEKGPKDHLSCK